MTTASAPARRRARNDRLIVAAALVGVAVLSWLYLIGPARSSMHASGGTSGGMSGMSHMADMAGMGSRPWSAEDFVLTAAMWAVMMLAMMLPSILPLTLVYAAVRRKALRQQTPVPATGVFVAGYALVWTVFGLVATTVQLLLDRAARLTPQVAMTSTVIGGGLVLAAGIYELTPFKQSCLRACRGPADFISRRWRTGTGGALRLGGDAGLYCLGCCWLIMALLFVGGVMNLLCVATIALFVLAEKVAPHGGLTSRLGGWAMVAGGVGMLVYAAA